MKGSSLWFGVSCGWLLVHTARSAAATGNFGISADTCALTAISVNPPQFGAYLATVGAGALLVSVDDDPWQTYDAITWAGETVFPVCDVEAAFSGGAVAAHVHTFAPMAFGTPAIGFYPLIVIMIDSTAINANHSLSFAYSLQCDPAVGLCNASETTEARHLPASHSAWSNAQYGNAGAMYVGGATTAGSTVSLQCPDGYPGNLCATVRMSVGKGSPAAGMLIVANFMENGTYTSTFASGDALVQYAFDEAVALEDEHDGFVYSLPVTGDGFTDESVRWYLQSALLLTKGVLNQTITMGYVELNQRDSFWTTWFHALYYPGLDTDMLVESAQYQQPDGHIPTTVLPLILRPDNIDITAYFVLRLARHIEYTGNTQILVDLYPTLKRAMSYLKSRDTGEGVPSAYNFTFWADWLDIPEMQGRRFDPHYDLLYLACCRAAADMAATTGNKGDAGMYQSWYASGFEFVNRNFSYVWQPEIATWTATGLWNATHYQDAWFDGRAINWTYNDQAVGAFFGVVPEDRAQMISKWFETNENEGPWGMRNVYPYVDWVVNPGQYANGGVYPWHNCVDITNRFLLNATADGQRIFRNMAGAMLYRSDNIPLHTAWEYLDGDTGVAMGNWPQGWDAACFVLPILAYARWERVSSVRVRARSPFPATHGAGWDRDDVVIPAATMRGWEYQLTLTPAVLEHASRRHRDPEQPLVLRYPAASGHLFELELNPSNPSLVSTARMHEHGVDSIAGKRRASRRIDAGMDARHWARQHPSSTACALVAASTDMESMASSSCSLQNATLVVHIQAHAGLSGHGGHVSAADAGTGGKSTVLCCPADEKRAKVER